VRGEFDLKIGLDSERQRRRAGQPRRRVGLAASYFSLGGLGRCARLRGSQLLVSRLGIRRHLHGLSRHLDLLRQPLRAGAQGREPLGVLKPSRTHLMVGIPPQHF
jgi:hypothetical protein